MSNPRIKLNGVYLDELRTPLRLKYPANSRALFSRPREAHDAFRLDRSDTVVIRTSAVTAPQLFYDGVLARGGSATLVVGGSDWGLFRVSGLVKEDGHDFGEPMRILLEPV